MLVGNHKSYLCWKSRCQNSFVDQEIEARWLTRRGIRLIEYISGHDGVEWVKMEDICDDFKKKNQPVKGALLPAEHGAILKNPEIELQTV